MAISFRSRCGLAGALFDRGNIDVLCELTAEQADEVALRQAAQVHGSGRHKGPWEARIVFVGVAADKNTGRVPVRVRLKNPEERLRCFVEVKVRFAPGPRSEGTTTELTGR